MTPYTFIEDVEAEVPVPDNGVLRRTLFDDDALKVVAFGFSAGQELSAHTATMAALLHFLRGETELTLGNEKRDVRAGVVVHMSPGLTHAIIAKTPLLASLRSFRRKDSGSCNVVDCQIRLGSEAEQPNKEESLVDRIPFANHLTRPFRIMCTGSISWSVCQAA